MIVVKLVNADGKEYGLLVYLGHKGEFYEIVGFKNGKEINLRKL